MLNRTLSVRLGVPLGVCSENKAKNLEIRQEEPTTSENIPDNFSEIDQLFKEVKQPQLESISNVFIGNTGVFNVTKCNSEPKQKLSKLCSDLY